MDEKCDWEAMMTDLPAVHISDQVAELIVEVTGVNHDACQEKADMIARQYFSSRRHRRTLVNAITEQIVTSTGGRVVDVTFLATFRYLGET